MTIKQFIKKIGWSIVLLDMADMKPEAIKMLWELWKK